MTNQPTGIVVGVDGSSESLRALDWATEEARLRGRPLRILHAFVWPMLNVPLGPGPMAPPGAGLRNAAERILADAADQARRAAPELTVRVALPERAPAVALIEASHGADLVVVGSRGLGGFAGLLLGSVGVQVASHAACPVVVVRGEIPEPVAAGAMPGEVLVGVDGSELSDLAVGFAFEHAHRHGFGVAAVHVTHSGRPGGPEVPADDPAAAEARLLAGALAGWREKYPTVPVRSEIVAGRPAEVLVKQAAGAQLVVVGARGRGGFAGLLLGSVSQTVLHHAPAPVAVVRGS